MKEKEINENPTLYLVPTPIGNMEDITLRSIRVLKEVEVIFCEDTRITRQLLKHFDIKKELIACNDHNEEKMKIMILGYLEQNKNIALVSDRGTPVVSDPGYKIVSYVVEKGYNVVGLPGATALIPALIVSGLPPNPFLFYGFLNNKVTKKQKELEKLKSIEYTIIFYEAPHRLLETLALINKIFGSRKISISREISKKFEEVYYTNSSQYINEKIKIKGEFVIVVEGSAEKIYDYLTIIEHVNLYIREGYSEKDAIKLVAKDRNIAKSLVYKKYHVR